MSEATLRSATAYAGRTSLESNRPSPGLSPRLPSAILHTIPQDEPAQPLPEEEQSTTTRPPFAPFYTLINDTANSTTHHPVNVHYIFSDDDTDILTTACLAAVPGPSSQSSSGLTARSASSSMQSPTKEQQPPMPNANSRPSSKSGPGITNSQSQSREPERRTILIDLDETGTHVTSAQSLSSSWQIMNTNLSPAPIWDEGPGGEGEGAARFMLSIGGLNGIKQQAGIPQEKEVTNEDFKRLREEFEKRMGILRTVVDAGDKRPGVERESAEEEVDEKVEEPHNDIGKGKEVIRE